MITIKYNSWSELPIGIYFKLLEMQKEEQENPIISRLALMCDEDEETLMSTNALEIFQLNNKIKWLSDSKMNIRKIDKVKIDGITYKVTKDPKDITAAQYIDFDLLKSDVVKFYPNIIATILVPEGKVYGKDYSQFDLADMLADKLDIETAESINFTFAEVCKKSTSKALRQYIKTTARKTLREKDKEMKKTYLKVMKDLAYQKDSIDGLIWLT